MFIMKFITNIRPITGMSYISSRVPTGQGKLEKVREFEWPRKGQGKISFGKVRENEKLVPPDVRFSG